MEEREELSWMKRSRPSFLQGSKRNITPVKQRDFWIGYAEKLSFSSQLHFH
ncbi:hypothetical protein CARUB_v10015052mg [Capsella rubella]|uniref:Uncharacterized protein n=1 Tax=Capsella rubella TaxID=81985 RepID=R0HPY1_9BRAS|nr:hypothetical protein CARUB_v10015052mg [Capsella rubella]EOA31829.1 hypothetical protein CARUB_v10015052mg [Capsella rubella]